MEILTINLPQDLCEEITCELGNLVYRATSFPEAFEELQCQDFKTIICGVSCASVSDQCLGTLLGLSFVSTQIILIGDAADISNYFAYRELGIELLVNPSCLDITNRIRADLEPSLVSGSL